MIPLEDMPLHVVLKLLQKMELSAFVRSRKLNTFLFNFIQQNSRKFNFLTQHSEVVVYFGNLENNNFRLQLTSHHPFERYHIDISDPAISLAGLRFYKLIIEECYEERDDQSVENYNEYLKNKDSVFQNQVLPTLKLLENRAEWLRLHVQDINVRTLAETFSCSKLFVHFPWVQYRENPLWLCQPGFENITHLRLDQMADFGLVKSLLPRFEYIHANIGALLEEQGNRQDDVNIILKELAKDVFGPRSLILTSEESERLIYSDGREFYGIMHNTLFEEQIFVENWIDYGYVFNILKVVSIVVRNSLVLVIILRTRDNERVFRPGLQYFIEACSPLDHERIALFVMERGFNACPIDISILYQKLQEGGDVSHNVHEFLMGYFM